MTLSSEVLAIVARPSARPIPEAIRAVGEALRGQYGEAVQGVLFYGSCLRAGTDQDSLVDCYVLVDQYRSVYPTGWLALLNRWLPPNVFYLEVPRAERVVRVKYAILSLRDFERSVTSRWFHSYFWGRFAQPTVLLIASDEEMTTRIHQALGMAVVTFFGHVFPRLPVPFSAKDLWMVGLTLSYGAELRAESSGRVQTLWESDRDYYEPLTKAVLTSQFPLVQLKSSEKGLTYEVEFSPWERLRNRLAWSLRKAQGKVLSVLRLIKAAFTFRGGVDYLIWKIERHSGVKIQLTPAQRRHPIWAGLTTFWRLYRQGAFR